jgi:hypothetical protein
VRRLFITFGIVTLCGTPFAYALFSDADISVITIEDLEPAETGSQVVSLPTVNYDAYACMRATATSDDEVSLTEPEAAESDVADIPEDVWDGELIDSAMIMFFWADDGDGIYEDGEQKLVADDVYPFHLFSTNLTFATALAVPGLNTWGGTSPIASGTVRHVGVLWCMGEGLGVDGDHIICDGSGFEPTMITDRATIEIELAVVQVAENEPFSCENIPPDSEPEPEADPPITILSPNGGEVLIPGLSVEIQWETSTTTFTDVELELMRAGGDDVSIGTVPNTGSYTWIVPGEQTGHGFKIRAGGEGGFDESDEAFTIFSEAQAAAEPSAVRALGTLKKIAAWYLQPEIQAADSILNAAGLLSCLGTPTPAFLAFFGGCVLAIAEAIGLDAAADFAAKRIVNDPPRDDFHLTETVSLVPPEKPFDQSKFARALAKYLAAIENENAYHLALVTTFERLQGAIIANEPRFMLLQNEALHTLVGQLIRNHTHKQTALRSLRDAMLADGKDVGLADLFLDAMEHGLSASDKLRLHEAGMREADIEKIEDIFNAVSDDADPYELLASVFEVQIAGSMDAESELRAIQKEVGNASRALRKLANRKPPVQ